MVEKFNVSISVSEDTLLKIRELIRTGKFRNRSHVIEYAVHAMDGEQ